MPVMLTVNPTVWSLPVDPASSDLSTAATIAAPAVDPWAALRRYLLVGGLDQVVASPAPVAPGDAGPVRVALAVDSLRVVAEILAATAAMPSRPEPMLLALALASATDDDLTRRAALTALPRVARTSHDLFLFATFVQGLRGWGRGLRRAIGAWYNDRPVAALVEDVLTTPTHAGWRHADLLRLGHPKAPTPTHDIVYRWLVTGVTPSVVPDDPAEPDAGAIVARLAAAGRLAAEKDPDRAAALIGEHRLPLGTIPSALRRSPVVWRALLPHLPLRDLVACLPELAVSGALDDTELLGAVHQCLGDCDAVARVAVPPLAVLAARRSYEAGYRNGSRWAVDHGLIRALDLAFDAACRRFEPPAGPVCLLIPEKLDQAPTTPGGLAPIDVAAALALVLFRSGGDVTIEVAGPIGRPLRPGPADGLDEVVAALRRMTVRGDDLGNGQPVLTIRSAEPGGNERVIDLWSAAPSPDSTSLETSHDRIAIHGLDHQLVETVLHLMRDRV